MTIGGRPKTTTPKPLTMPMRAPIASTIGMTQIDVAFEPLMRPAARIPQKPITHGTDKSSPPVRITVP